MMQPEKKDAGCKRELGLKLANFRRKLGAAIGRKKLTQGTFGEMYGGYTNRVIASYELGDVDPPDSPTVGLNLKFRPAGRPNKRSPMKTSTAILLGFALVALAHLFQPTISTWLVGTAHAQSYGRVDVDKITDYLYSMSNSLYSISKNCRH